MNQDLIMLINCNIIPFVTGYVTGKVLQDIMHFVMSDNRINEEPTVTPFL